MERAVARRPFRVPRVDHAQRYGWGRVRVSQTKRGQQPMQVGIPCHSLPARRVALIENGRDRVSDRSNQALRGRSCRSVPVARDIPGVPPAGTEHAEKRLEARESWREIPHERLLVAIDRTRDARVAAEVVRHQLGAAAQLPPFHPFPERLQPAQRRAQIGCGR
jgi:hypothetical protein